MSRSNRRTDGNFFFFSVTENDKGRYTWPETISGHKVNLPCELEDKKVFPYATHSCSINGTWVELDTSNCAYTSNITRILQESSRVRIALLLANEVFLGMI